MKIFIQITILFIALMHLLPFTDELKAQTDCSAYKYLNVFLDCEFCDQYYVKQEISFVNYVRDPKDADVHILITNQSTGSGGQEYSFLFVGANKFELMTDNFTYHSKPDDTEDEIRKGITSVISAGLMRYIAKTELVTLLNIDLGIIKDSKPVLDPWKSWVFNSNLSGSFSGEELNSANSYSLRISALKTTKKQKILVYNYYNYQNNRFIISDTTIRSYNYSQNINFNWVKSLNNHWSAGIVWDNNSSTYRNIKFKSNFFPAIEYNLFPYSESSVKMFRFMYGIGYCHFWYNDTTIFNKTNESLFGQNFDITLIVKKTWGSVTTAINVFNYLNDFSIYEATIWGELNIRLFKGFSVSLSVMISSINDQIYLSKSGITSEEILLQRKQMSTSYSYQGSIGITYTFGSIYNNVVNPRFGI